MPLPALLTVILFGAGLCLGACAPRADLPVSWSFADGRGCADAGVELVQLIAPSEGRSRTFLFRCEPPRAAVGPLGAGAEISAAGLTPAGGTLYRGSATLSRTSPPSSLELLLLYTGGR